MIGGVVNIKTIHFDFIYVHFANTVLRNIKFALHGTLNFTHDHILKEDRPFRRYSNLTHDDDLEWPSNVDCWIFWIDFLVVLYYFFIKRHVETVKPIPKWFKTVCSDSLWNIYVVIDFSSRNIFFRLRLKNVLFRLWNRFSLLNDFSFWNVRIFRVKNPEKNSKSKSQKIAMVNSNNFEEIFRFPTC